MNQNLIQANDVIDSEWNEWKWMHENEYRYLINL